MMNYEILLAVTAKVTLLFIQWTSITLSLTVLLVSLDSKLCIMFMIRLPS